MDDYNKRMKEYMTDLVKQEIVGLGEETKRDYKKEYAKYGSSTKAKKYRAELNQYNRKKGTYGNGDGKDASHKGGKIVGFESQSKNRGRAEKSRLKKEGISDKMSDIMSKLAKSLGVKSVVSMHTGKGSLSYFIDDKMEAKKLENMLKKTFKRVRLIPLDKSKGDTANFVVAADMLGLESVNESEQDKIKQYFIKKGDNEKDATDKLRFYNVVKKLYKGAPPAKRAQIMSSLWANESVNEGKKQYGQKLTDNFFKSVRKFEQEVIVLGKMATKIRGDRTDEKIILKMYKKHMGPFIELIRSWNDTTQKNPGISESKKPELLDESLLKQIKQAEKIAKSMAGNMTGAVKGIEKIRRGLSRHKRVRVALRKYNESVDEGKLSEDYKNSEWEVYVADEKGKEKIVKKAKSKRAGVILYNKLINSDNYYEVGMRVVKESVNESVNEGVSKSQAQEIMRQLGGRKFEMLMGVKSKSVGTDGLILHIGKNPKKVSHIIIDLNRDEYDLTFGKIFNYNWKVIKKVKGVGVEQLHDMIEKYTGLYTTFGSRK